jgi:enamine deaminase RidA (YjgF/YER057c/UK114 family)
MSDIRRFDGNGFLSRAVVADGHVYVSGLTARDKSGGVYGQTKDVLAQIDQQLAAVGTSRARILRANIWLVDIATFPEMNKAWQEWVDPQNLPARATVGAPLAGNGNLVEIMVEALL